MHHRCLGVSTGRYKSGLVVGDQGVQKGLRALRRCTCLCVHVCVRTHGCIATHADNIRRSTDGSLTSLTGSTSRSTWHVLLTIAAFAQCDVCAQHARMQVREHAETVQYLLGKGVAEQLGFTSHTQLSILLGNGYMVHTLQAAVLMARSACAIGKRDTQSGVGLAQTVRED